MNMYSDGLETPRDYPEGEQAVTDLVGKKLNTNTDVSNPQPAPTINSILRRVHFAAADINELSDSELYDDPQGDCEHVIAQVKSAIESMVLDIIGPDKPPEYGIASVGDRARVIGDISAVYNSIKAEQRQRLIERLK